MSYITSHYVESDMMTSTFYGVLPEKDDQSIDSLGEGPNALQYNILNLFAKSMHLSDGNVDVGARI